MSEAIINPDELPSSWAMTTLGTVVNYGSTNKAEPSEIADSDWILELEDIEKDSSRLLQRVTFSKRRSKSTKNSFKAGDVLYGKLRPYLNKVLIADQAGYCSTEVLPLETAEHLDNRYLFYWLKHPVFLKYVEAKSHGMNMPRLGTDTGRAAPFVLAPYVEQTRIADQLDVLLARVQACNGRFDAIPALLKQFRQTVLERTISKFIASHKTEIEKSCVMKRIGDVATVGTGSTPLRSISKFYASSGIPWITSSATSSRFICSANEYVTRDAIVAHRLTIYPVGTLLVAMYGEGKTRGQVSELAIEATINQACAAIIVNEEKVYKKYLKMMLDANYLAMRELAEGGNQPNLNLSKIREFELPIPTLNQQIDIVRRVETLFALADRIETRYIAARAHAQRLTPLLLAKAFRGELVPQDPNDEPASVLLQRIAAQRTQADLLPKPRKPRVPRAARAPKETTGMTKSRQDADVKNQPYLADHLRRLGGANTAEALFKVAELPVADFYKQLAWEVDKGHIKDRKTALEAAHAP